MLRLNPPRHRSFAGRLRPAALHAALLALVFAQVLGGFHLLREQHAICPEHGEIVEGVAADHHHPAPGTSIVADHDTHHCAIAAALGQAAPTRNGPVLVVTAVVHETATHLPAPPLNATGVPLLRYAPKTSPPSA
jgi:hypothetical protein